MSLFAGTRKFLLELNILQQLIRIIALLVLVAAACLLPTTAMTSTLIRENLTVSHLCVVHRSS